MEDSKLMKRRSLKSKFKSVKQRHLVNELLVVARPAHVVCRMECLPARSPSRAELTAAGQGRAGVVSRVD